MFKILFCIIQISDVYPKKLGFGLGGLQISCKLRKSVLVFVYRFEYRIKCFFKFILKHIPKNVKNQTQTH